MKLSASEQDSIVALLTRIYVDICAIETQYGLLAGEGDFRPRIEYFHDAVRALSSDDLKHREPGGRLNVEYLAYDLSCLRYLQSMPLAPFKPHGYPLSPQTGLVALDQKPVPAHKRPDRAIKEKISDLYQHYAVLFAALLKPAADRDYKDRVDHLNQDVQNINTLLDQFDHKEIDAAAATVQNMDDAALRQELMEFLHQQKYKKSEALKQQIAAMKKAAAKKDREIAAVEAAHMNYSLSQLGIFEGSKDMLKKLAQHGTNLVGKFVAESLKQAQREMGR